MKICRDENMHGNLLPAACGKLSLISLDLLFNEKYSIRHPDSIYAISLEKLLFWVQELLNEFDRVASVRSQSPNVMMEMSGLLWRYEAFIKSAQEHFESHFQVLRTLIDPARSKSSSQFAEKYVKENQLPGFRTFASAVQPYGTLLKCVNHLKHNHAVLRYIGTAGPPSVDGFFFEEMNAGGVLGPSPVLHPGGFGLSFIRELSMHLFYVYFNSQKLLDVVDAILETKGRPKFSTASLTRSSLYFAQSWKAAMLRMSLLPLTCFPHETNKKMPRFRFSNNDITLSINLSNSVTIKWPSEMIVRFEHRIDGHNPTLSRPNI